MVTRTKGSRGKSASSGQYLTAYRAAQLTNQALAEAGIKKKIPVQMIYNYTHARLREGKRPIIHYTKTRGIERKDFERWLSEYLEKQPH